MTYNAFAHLSYYRLIKQIGLPRTRNQILLLYAIRLLLTFMLQGRQKIGHQNTFLRRAAALGMGAMANPEAQEILRQALLPFTI
jgi:hypothetical protein